jgi:TRAP-type mannitol/chloroaromatic compound transport system permease small subunit
MANLKGLMGALILVIVGSVLFPVVESFCTTAAGTNTSATKYAIWNVMPIFFILLVLGGVVASLIASFRG